jgi:monoamine oxidase
MTSKPLPQTFNPPGIASPKPTYSHVCTFTLGSTKIITVVGQIGTYENETIDHCLEFQVLLALENVRNCLLSTGAAPCDIMKVTQYIVDFDPTNRKPSELYAKFMDGHTPPVTLIPVEKLAWPGLLYEIEVMAIVAVNQEG